MEEHRGYTLSTQALQQQSETTTMIENAPKATKSELLLNQARLEMRIMEKIGSPKKENASTEITRVKGTDGANFTSLHVCLFQYKVRLAFALSGSEWH